ncbi:MAG TPA: FAD-dependent oxidoreductase [Mucilaginibacter sp.]|jgi:uncharacterized protein with NAD-binding domain and iron-sulfur cluster
MEKKKVIILGGGVAGMSAAHELIERGFEVQVFEQKVQTPGGKARSVAVPDPDAGDHYNPLPGEHGFRFFPGFYRHVIDTMRRIPFPGNKNGVFDNLVAAPHAMMARDGKDPIVLLDSFPKSIADLKFLLKSLHQKTGISLEDSKFFEMKVWQLMTSCQTRRENDYERMGWWQYTDGANRDKTYQNLLASGLTRTLVAARATTASTKTGGDIFLQLIFNMANPDVATDRILNGPTNDQWLWPWHKYLVKKGVDYRFLSQVTSIECTNNAISGVWVQKLDMPSTVFNDAGAAGLSSDNPPQKYTADYYILAVPVERAAPLLIGDILKGQTIQDFLNNVIRNADLSDPSVSILDITNNAVGQAAIMKADPTLIGIIELSNDVSWMTGVQFYLNEVVTLNEGHIIFSDSPWAITAISQSQFWKSFPMDKFADGKVKTVLSCDVSEWDEKGILYGKVAKDCTPEEIRTEVWAQMKKALMVNGKCMINDDMIHTWFIDRDIVFSGANAVELLKGDYFSQNTEPLLVNKVDTWRLRPESHCAIPNLFFASDYVRTHTDLATMEGANEAGRRAVNNIIEASGVDAPLCDVWRLHEPWIFSFLRLQDYWRYNRGLAWNEHFPWWVRFIQWIISLFKKGAKKSNAKKSKKAS